MREVEAKAEAAPDFQISANRTISSDERRHHKHVQPGTLFDIELKGRREHVVAFVLRGFKVELKESPAYGTGSERNFRMRGDGRIDAQKKRNVALMAADGTTPGAREALMPNRNMPRRHSFTKSQ